MADSVPVEEEVPLPQPQVPPKGMRRKSIAKKKKKHKHKRVVESDNESISVDFVASTPNDEEYQKTVASTPNGEEHQKTQEQETHADPEMEEESSKVIKKRKRTGEEKKKKKKKDKGLYDENETTTPMNVAEEPTKEDDVSSSANRALCLEDPKEDNADCGEKTTPILKSCDEFEVVNRVISELELLENGDRLDSPEKQTSHHHVEEATSLKGKSSRVWSEEDEVAILRGIIKFKDEKGMEPRDNAREFHEFVKGSLRLQSATVIQLKDKMRRLKDKYEKYVAESRTLNGPREEELFNLSHKIWSIPIVNADDEKHPSGGEEKHPSGVDEKHPSGGDEKTARRLRRKEKRQQTMEEEQSDGKNEVFYDTIKLSNFDKSCAEELDSILKVMTFGGSNSKKTTVNQMELLLKSLHIRESFVSRVLQSSEEEDFSELEKEDLMMSYSKAKMEHSRLISEAFASLVKDRNQAQ